MFLSFVINILKYIILCFTFFLNKYFCFHLNKAIAGIHLLILLYIFWQHCHLRLCVIKNLATSVPFGNHFNYSIFFWHFVFVPHCYLPLAAVHLLYKTIKYIFYYFHLLLLKQLKANTY